jgi:hypothetical protein
MVMNVQYSTYFFHTLHTQMVRGGQGNFFFKKSANHSSANSWAHSAIANPQISQVCQSANVLGLPVCKSQINKFL